MSLRTYTGEPKKTFYKHNKIDNKEEKSCVDHGGK